MKVRVLTGMAYSVGLLSCVAGSVSAAEWSTSAGVAPAIVYTDNVCLSSDNEKGEWIGRVTPDVSIVGNGNKANVSLNAAVEVNSLSDSDLEDRECEGGLGYGDREQFAPAGNAAADAVLIEDWLYIDANASAFQNSITPYASGGGDSLDRTGNTNTTYRYSVSPYIQRRFKDLADLTLRYTYDDQYNSSDLVGDSTEDSAQLNLASGTSFSPVSMGIRGDYSKVEYSGSRGRDFDSDNELKSAQFNLGYQLDRTWQVNGYYGREWNDFVSTRDDIDGDFWDAGLRWTPNSRTTVDAGTGDRFFGSTPRFSVNYRHKRSVLTASYRKDITYDRNIRTLAEAPVGGNPTTLSNSPILDERFILGYAYEGRRSGFGISAGHSDQTRLGSPRPISEELNFSESKFTDVSMRVNRSISRKLSLSGGIGWERREPKKSTDTFGEDYDTWRANFGVQRQLGENTSLSFDYQYTDRQPNETTTQPGNFFNEYTENRFTLTLRVAL
jgi:hypothetical protein